MEQKTYQHWQLRVDKNQFMWATLDKAGKAVNSMNDEVLDELSCVLDQASSCRGLAICSGKKTGFIAGADISSFSKWEGSDDAMKFIRKGHAVYEKLSKLNIPTVAVIDGFCLGGGLELALACRYRIAEDSDKTKLGLPETKLGIFPAWGGSVRLPRLIGGMHALDLILSGRAIRAKQAKKMGLVDQCVPKRHLVTAATYYLEQQPVVHKPSTLQAMTNWPWVRSLLAWQAKKQLAKRNVLQAHYPAFYAVLDLFENNTGKLDACLQREAAAIEPVLQHPTAMSLVRVFELQERLKSFAKTSDFKAKSVHVIGAGTMGAEIAAVCAAKGLRVTLQDREPQYIAPAIKLAHKIFKRKLKTPRAVQAAMDRLIPDVEGRGVATADVIIEAIFENLEAKQSLFADIERKAKPDAVIATNTSTFPLEELTPALRQPERLVGIHFFNPVSKMPLVEVIFGTQSKLEIVKQAQSFVGQIDKLPLPVKSSPGFLVNRVLMPYLMECVNLVDEGISAEVIDKAATGFGMPMGPVELADKVGLDICLSAAESLGKHFPVKIPDSLRAKVSDGKLGQKTGAGFYQYKNGKPVRNKGNLTTKPVTDVTDRLILRMVNEAVACLREQVVADADLIDAGLIFGTGFAPFRGGPMTYLNNRGANELQGQLSDFNQRYGDRFLPDAGWNKLAESQ